MPVSGAGRRCRGLLGCGRCGRSRGARSRGAFFFNEHASANIVVAAGAPWVPVSGAAAVGGVRFFGALSHHFLMSDLHLFVI